MATLPSFQFGIGSDSKVQFAEIGNRLLGLFEFEGILESDDSGHSWEYIHEGLPNPIHVTEFTLNDSTLWLGSSEFGLFRRSISDLPTLSITQPKPTPATLKIFPNPTRGTFTCKIPLEISGEATLTVFDLQGKQMLRQTSSTEHLQNIDLGRVAKGVYWVSVLTQKGIFGGKVVLE